MGIGEKASVECVFALSWLQAIGDQMDLSVQLRDQIQTLRLQLQLLNNILMCTEHCSEDMELNYFLEGVGEVVSDIHSSLFNINYGNIQELDSIVMNALENMNVIKTDIVLLHVLFSKLSCSQGQMSDGILLEFLEMSMENLKGLMKSKADLLAPLKEQIGILEEKLRLLRNFFHFARNGYIEHENLGHLATVIGALVYKMGCLGALYWIDEMDDDMASRLRLKLCQLLQKIELVMPEVILILIKFQKASMLLQSNKTTITDKLLWDFVYLIIENLKEFIKGMGVLDDQVESLYVEFRLLRTSLIKQQRLVKKLLSESYRVYIRSNCAIKMVDLLTRTEAVSKEAATKMNSFGILDTSDEDRALGINFSCFDLLEKFISFSAEGMQDLQSHIMKQRENAQPPEYDPLNCLECQEKHKGLSAELKDAIQRLKLKFGFLQLILRWWSGEDCDLRLIHKVIKASSAYCHKACVAINYGRLDSAFSNLEYVLSDVNNNKELGLWVKEGNYHFQVSSSHSVLAQLVGDFVDLLIKNVVYLLHYKLCFISSAKTKMEAFEEKLRFLRGFLNFTSKWCIQSEKLKKLITCIGTMADNAARLSYWCFDDEVKEQMADKVKLITSYLLEMIIPIDVEVREIYPQVLKASESSLPETPTRAEILVAFVDSLMENLMDLHNGKVRGMIPRWESSQIQTLCQGLRFLKAMIKDLSDQCVEHNMLNNLLMYIETEVSKIRPGTRKMNVEVLNFLVVIKLIKTDIYLKDVESSKTILTVSLKVETSTLSKELKSLITDVLGLVDYYANLDKLNDYLRHIEAVADQLQSVRYLFCMQNVNEDTDRMVRFAMLEFLVKIRTIKAEVSLVKLLEKISVSVVPVKDKIETIQEELEFLVNHLGQYSEPEKLSDLLIGIDDIVTQTGTTIDSFNLNEINKEIASKVNIGISGLLEKIELLKKNSQQICHRFPDLKRTYVPRTAELCFIDYLIEKLKQFLDCKGNVISQLKNQIERVQGELMSVRYLIGEVAQDSSEHEELKNLFTRSLYVAYEVEYVVGLSSSGIGDTFLYHRLCNATKEIILTKTKFKEIYEKKNGVSSNSFIITDKIQGASNVNCGIVDDVVIVELPDKIDGMPEDALSEKLKKDNSYVPPCYSFDISFVLRQFKLLLVLDLGSLNMGSSFPSEVQFLIHLRYLAVRIDTNDIPSFIDNLRNLETFLVKGRRGEIALPDTLWNMVRLRHLHVDNRASFALLEYRKELLKYSYQLENLKTFSSPILARGEHSIKIIRRLPNLQKLRCWFVESWEGYSKRFKGKCNQFPALDFLAQLESLKVFYCGHQVLHPCEFNFPSNLKKLTLSNFRLPWCEISKIAKSLPNLEVLYLKFRACNDKRWEVGYEEFPKLKILKLDRLNIEKWEAPEDAFPRLQRLVLQKCKHLEEIPESMDFMDTLQTIDVHWCTHSAVNSAIRIWKNQHDELGNDGFKVSIQPLDCDPRASPLGLLNMQFNSE
nr:putative late blight resistance protein homolog R1A-4 [Ipomoea batatas]